MVFTPETTGELQNVIKEYLDNKELGIKKYGIMNDWNVSKITDMSYLFSTTFYSLTKFYVFNEYIGDWDVSNVTKMNSMFYMNYDFDQDISGWDVSNVTDMNYMFYDCKFNKPLNNWDVSNVTNMESMFGYSSFNQSLNNWDVSNVTNMKKMFQYCHISQKNKPVKKICVVVKLYKKLTSEQKEENTECPISTDEYKEDTKVVITKCNHIFGYDGFKLWIDSSNNNTCPYCRSTL